MKMRLTEVDLTGAWGGITLANGSSIVPQDGKLYYSPFSWLPELAPDGTTAEKVEERNALWEEQQRANQIRLCW
jgi:hypothetical protein